MSSYFNLDKYGTNPGRHLLQTNLVRSLWGGLTATLVFLLLKATSALKKYILQTPGQSSSTVALGNIPNCRKNKLSLTKQMQIANID